MPNVELSLLDALLTMGISRDEIIASYAEFINELKKGDDEQN